MRPVIVSAIGPERTRGPPYQTLGNNIPGLIGPSLIGVITTCLDSKGERTEPLSLRYRSGLVEAMEGRVHGGSMSEVF